MAKRNFAARVPIPHDDAINSGLTNAKQSTMLRIFGKPGKLSKNCSEPTNPKVQALLVTRNVGPFKVRGIKPAVDSLARIFARVKAKDPELYEAIQTAGMLCCRAVRGSTRNFSNHSFGTAIDLYCGDDVVPMGVGETHVGVLALYPYFHAEGWYWLAESSRPDGMHYEVSEEKMLEWDAKGVV